MFTSYSIVPLGSLLQEIIVAYLYTKWSIVAKSFVSKLLVWIGHMVDRLASILCHRG